MTTMAPQEQLLLEMINRARLDPAAEAARYHIDLNQFNQTGVTLTADAKQPLAGNNLLANAAEGHSQYLADHNFINVGGDPHAEASSTPDPASRIKAAGYTQSTSTSVRPENVEVNWSSGFTWDDAQKNKQTAALHEGFFIDNPQNHSGTPGGHRVTMLDPNAKEVGLGVVIGTSASGQNYTIVTQDFGVAADAKSFLTGVVYNDTITAGDSKDFYDVGEGRANVIVTVTGVGSDTTGSGGGWSVAVPGGTYTVTYSSGGLAAAVSATVEAGNLNAKIDLVNGNEIFTSANTTLGQNATELHLLGVGNINGTGNSDANIIVGNKGNNVIDGGAGIDTVVFSGNRASYSITVNAGSITVSGPDGIDTLKGVEKLKFADVTIDAPGQPAPVAGSLSIVDNSVLEGNSGTKTIAFTVNRAGGDAALDVTFATVGSGNATAGSDYVAKTEVVHFNVGDTSKQVLVTVNGDTAFEGHETFGVQLSNATNGATISKATAVGTITNDDAAPVAGSLSIVDNSVLEGNSGTKTIAFTVNRTGGDAALDVTFATVAGSGNATAGSDYVTKSEVVHFNAGEISKQVLVTVNGDTAFEGNETFNVQLSNATNGATLRKATAVGTITDDDTAPVAGSLSIIDTSVVEGNSGSKTMAFTVNRAGGDAALDVTFATVAGSGNATAGSDYVTKSEVVHFNAGEISKQVLVTVNGDTAFEGNETFNVQLSNATGGAILSKATAVGTITNDDRAAHDFNGDGRSDILWHNDNGSVALWQMNGTQIAANQLVGSAGTAWDTVGIGDFNGDGRSDLLWHSDTGSVAMWQMNGSQIAANAGVGSIGTAFHVADVADFNGDGRADILWENSSNGSVVMWQMNGSQIAANQTVGTVAVASGWDIAGTGDFNGDGRADILLHNDVTGGVAMWQMNGSQIAANQTFGTIGTAWHEAGIADFNGDGRSDILWHNDNGSVAIWQMNGTQVTSNQIVGSASTAWDIVDTGDFNGDGRADILWHNDATGAVAMWEMNGNQTILNQAVGTITHDWHLV